MRRKWGIRNRAIVLGAVVATAVAVCVVFNGCGSDNAATNGPAPVPGGSGNIKRLAIADLNSKIGDYMPRPLDGGKLEIASPESWDWKNPSSNHLVGFIPTGAGTLNSFPRILVSVEDAGGYSMQTANAGNIAQLAKEIGAELPEKTTAEPATPMIVGDSPCVTFVMFARSGKSVVKQQFAKVLVDGRIYTVMLEDYDRLFSKSRQAALTVVASMHFLDSATDGDAEVASPASEPVAEPPGDEPAAGED